MRCIFHIPKSSLSDAPRGFALMFEVLRDQYNIGEVQWALFGSLSFHAILHAGHVSRIITRPAERGVFITQRRVWCVWCHYHVFGPHHMMVIEFHNEPLDTPTSRSVTPKFDVLSLRAYIHIQMWVREASSKQESLKLLGEETTKRAATWSDVCSGGWI